MTQAMIHALEAITRKSRLLLLVPWDELTFADVDSMLIEADELRQFIATHQKHVNQHSQLLESDEECNIMEEISHALTAVDDKLHELMSALCGAGGDEQEVAEEELLKEDMVMH